MTSIIGLVDRYGVAAAGLVLALVLLGNVNDVGNKVSAISERLVRLETILEQRDDGKAEK